MSASIPVTDLPRGSVVRAREPKPGEFTLIVFVEELGPRALDQIRDIIAQELKKHHP